MSHRTFCWLFVWVAVSLGWFVRIIHVEVDHMFALLATFVGYGLLTGWPDWHLTHNHTREDE